MSQRSRQEYLKRIRPRYQPLKSRLAKKYDEPATPYQRLLKWQGLSAEKQQELDKLHQRLDPIAVKAAIERKLKRIFALVHPQRFKAVS